MIKNHLFSGGNKCIVLFVLVEFSHRNSRLSRNNVPVIDDIGLVGLFVEESDPKDDDVLIRSIMNMLAGVQ